MHCDTRSTVAPCSHLQRLLLLLFLVAFVLLPPALAQLSPPHSLHVPGRSPLSLPPVPRSTACTGYSTWPTWWRTCVWTCPPSASIGGSAALTSRGAPELCAVPCPRSTALPAHLTVPNVACNLDRWLACAVHRRTPRASRTRHDQQLLVPFCYGTVGMCAIVMRCNLPNQPAPRHMAASLLPRTHPAATTTADHTLLTLSPL